MNGINKVFIAGNLAAKPVVQKSKNGKVFSYLNIATNRFSYQEGQWNKTTYWHSVLVRGKTAETCGKVLDKGFPLAIEGFLESSKAKNLVVAIDVHFLGLRANDIHEAPNISIDD